MIINMKVDCIGDKFSVIYFDFDGSVYSVKVFDRKKEFLKEIRGRK